MATGIVDHFDCDAARRRTELEGALDSAIAALDDMQGVLGLILEEGSICRSDFPKSIAGSIRMISQHVDTIIPMLQGVRG
jgi:hypothetical protein